jgi:hypothetical protein
MLRKQSAGIFENVSDSLSLSIVRIAFDRFTPAVTNSYITIFVALRLLV